MSLAGLWENWRSPAGEWVRSLLEGYYQPFSTATLQSLYPTHGAYVSDFTKAAASDLAAGFLTPTDYNAAVAAAQASSVP